MEREILRASITCEDYKRVPTDDGRGIRMAPDGKTVATFSAVVDDRALALMAERAYRNKGGKSRLGPITVRILKREKLGVQHGR